MLLLCLALLGSVSCGSNKIKGSAADRTGTNGATNGNGKIPKAL